MAAVSLHQVSLRFGGPALLDSVDLQLGKGERVCLVGRNGAGKSSLMKVLSGELKPDTGEVSRTQGLTVARLEQEVPRDPVGTVFEAVAEGLTAIGPLLRDYHLAVQRLRTDSGEAALAALARAQHRLEAAGGWDAEQRVETALAKLSLDPDRRVADLSGGQKRRVLLARALVAEPDLLLLDEPTNHLDVASIEWLESYLSAFPGTVLFVTHDRAFLRAVATRILELDRGRLLSHPGDYDAFLARVEARLADEEVQNDQFDKVLAREEAWIRRGVKARTARNEGRVRALEELRRQRSRRRERQGAVTLEVQEASRSGELVAEVERIGHGFGGKALFENFSTLIRRRDRIGILGPNGCGKSTLVSILLGLQAPDRGRVRLGSALEIAYLDQMRTGLDDERTVAENVATLGAEYVEIHGAKRHIIGYLQDFLFEPARARTPVSALSGGERHRLLLAKLFSRPANLLVMDEPTNDLDSETLEVVEDRLLEYQGTLILVSHDRAFLDNVVTTCFAFDGQGGLKEYVGGYSDWVRQRAVELAQPPPRKPAAAPATAAATSPTPPPGRRPRTGLSFKEKRTLDGLPARIEELEKSQATLSALVTDPGFYKRPPAEIAGTHQELARLATEVAEAYQLWEDLEARK